MGSTMQIRYSIIPIFINLDNTSNYLMINWHKINGFSIEDIMQNKGLFEKLKNISIKYSNKYLEASFGVNYKLFEQTITDFNLYKLNKHQRNFEVFSLSANNHVSVSALDIKGIENIINDKIF